VVEVGPWRMEITGVDDRAITEVRVSRTSDQPSNDGADATDPIRN
jgi:hypothetical protein